MTLIIDYIIHFVEYRETKYSGVTIDRLKRDLKSKCGEERRKLLKDMLVHLNDCSFF